MCTAEKMHPSKDFYVVAIFTASDSMADSCKYVKIKKKGIQLEFDATGDLFRENALWQWESRCFSFVVNAGGSAHPSLSTFNEFVMRKNEKFPRKKKGRKPGITLKTVGEEETSKTPECSLTVQPRGNKWWILHARVLHVV